MKLFGLWAMTFGMILCAGAIAQQQQAPTPPEKELTVGEVVAIAGAINLIGGLDTGAFKLSGPTRMVMARNAALTAPVVQAFNDGMAKLRIDLAGARGKDVPKDRADDFNDGQRQMLDAAAHVRLLPMKRADLCLEAAPPACPIRNEIPIGAITALFPIMPDVE